jgi:hypothetical protein
LPPGPKYLHVMLDAAGIPGYQIFFSFVFHGHRQRSDPMNPLTDKARRRRYAEEAYPYGS